MKLAMTLLVRDEVDIVGRNIDFHLAAGVDHVVAVDNGSTDGTRDILQDYARQGVLTLIDEPGRDYAQSDWVTRAALLARDQLGADWILNNDADEFWRPRKGTLKDAIRAAGEAPALSVPRRNMICDTRTLATTPWEDSLTWRIAAPAPIPRLTDFRTVALKVPYFYLDLPAKVLPRARDLQTVGQGNHTAQFNRGAAPVPGEIDIFHFPVRGRSLFEKKIVQGGQAYAANTSLPEVYGWHWRRWYHLYRTEGLDRALEDALPTPARLEADRLAGAVIEDRGGVDLLAGLST